MSPTEHQNFFYPVDYLSVIGVAGDDAGKFLQGQLTCNINELTENRASIAAFCNPKGRVISTLILVKQDGDFLIILPRTLLDKVAKKLQMYVLRSKVELTKLDGEIRLIGLLAPEPVADFPWPFEAFGVNRNGYPVIKLPSSTPRFLCLLDEKSVTDELAVLAAKGFLEGRADEWQWLDIASGLPWFDEAQSEQYIPQMLNLDKLGGISFNKGCYTGQEIVARTHYLGKTKRQLYLAKCDAILAPSRELSVLDAATLEKQGSVLAWRSREQKSLLLIILQTVDEPAKPLILDDDNRTALALISCQ